MIIATTREVSMFAKYKSAEMNAALEEVWTAPDPVARKAAYDRVQQIYRRDLPFITFNPGAGHTVANEKICGLNDEGPFPSKTVGLGNC